MAAPPLAQHLQREGNETMAISFGDRNDPGTSAVACECAMKPQNPRRPPTLESRR